MIAENVENIGRRIDRACHRAGRSPSDVTLVAVSKTFPADHIREVITAGVCDFGENYVQEVVGKRELLSGLDVRWHFIGHLQSNKAKYLTRWVYLIHTLDSIKLAREIDRQAAGAGRTVEVLVEVNTTGESTKFGVAPDRAPELLRDLTPFQNIRVCGLMTMGPFLPDPEGSRPMFRQLRLLKENLSREKHHNVELRHLSMGMTGDFEVAIEEGATIVRIGTAIFGSRKKQGRND